MPSNKETLFQDHICAFLEKEHKYIPLSKEDFTDREHHVIEKHLISFIKATQADKYAVIEVDYTTDTDQEIVKALKEELSKKELWLIMRNGLQVKGTHIELYKPKPRSTTSTIQEENYKGNIYSYTKEYYYNWRTQERIDIVIWLNGLPIIVIELKHEDEGQTCEDAIFESYLMRDLENQLYKMPFLYVAASNTEVKVATNPCAACNFRWFNAQLVNKAETNGEYPIEHLYRHALSKENIAKYLEHYLVFVPAKEVITEHGEMVKKSSFTIFPRYHQLRASKLLAEDVKEYVNKNNVLGKKYLINHSAGSGKTLTIAWMADLLDSLYTDDNEKIFDNIVILTDRRSLDKNVKDDLEMFSHLASKLNFTDRANDLANYLDKNRAIIVTTIHKFSYIQDKLKSAKELQNRKIAFLIDEAHRSQDGKMALTQRQFFNKQDIPDLEEGEDTENEIEEKIRDLDTSNQVFVAFTATTTPKTVSFFGEPFDTYSESEAIQEGYILDVAQNIISYETLYNLSFNSDYIPKQSDGKDFPAGVLSKALKTLAYNDDDLIQYKSGVIINLFEQHVLNAIKGKGKAMMVASSRPAGLKYYRIIKAMLEEKGVDYKVLYAFSKFTDSETNEIVDEVIINQLNTLHNNKLIEDVFDLDDYRILVVANKFQTGFDQPLLSAMFLDKPVNGINAVQTVSRLNRKHKDKEQDDILVVDFTNNANKIFEAFNKHRKGSPYIEKEPDKNILPDLYEKIIATEIFTEPEIDAYINAYILADEEARKRNSTADALLSNMNLEYRELFRKRRPSIEDRKNYISLLKRFTKLFRFAAQFFIYELSVNNFIVFAEVMGDMLIKKGKTSEMTQLLRNIELTKGAVKLHGSKSNMQRVKEPRVTGLRTGGEGRDQPRSTIDEALSQIEEIYQINKEDAIIIKEICNDVSKQYEIKENIIANKDNAFYLRNNVRNRVRRIVTNEYMTRGYWDKLVDPIYIDRGGIISIMGKTIINTILRGIG